VHRAHAVRNCHHRVRSVEASVDPAQRLCSFTLSVISPLRFRLPGYSRPLQLKILPNCASPTVSNKTTQHHHALGRVRWRVVRRHPAGIDDDARDAAWPTTVWPVATNCPTSARPISPLPPATNTRICTSSAAPAQSDPSNDTASRRSCSTTTCPTHDGFGGIRYSRAIAVNT
jgi:hypothetical protein